MTNNIDRAAEVIGQLTGDGELGRNAAQAIAQYLADEGCLMPDLPALHRRSWAALEAHGHVYIRYGVDDMLLTPAEAREIAYDLLAAADHAEGVGRADA